MGGLCGWVGTGPSEADPLRTRRPAMSDALAHRGTVCWLGWDQEGEGVAIDSSFNSAEQAASAWTAWSGDPAAFASRLEGSFAVAALDRRSGRLVLARDRLGEKPLYYVSSREGVAFASEIKALRAGGALPDPALRPDALDCYLAFTYIPAPFTIFERVFKVPAGHCVEFDLKALAADRPGARREQRYWSLPERAGEVGEPARMIELLAEGLRRRLAGAGDAPGSAAVFLSGGLDSSVVAALMAREGHAGAPAFSIGFQEAALDESAHARRVASLVGARHHLITLRDVEPEMVQAVLAQLDEPMADAATIPAWVLAREAADSGVRVAMTGDGADALMAGDHWFRRLRRLDLLERLPAGIRPLLPLAALPAGPRAFRSWRGLAQLLQRDPAERYLRIRQKWTPEDRLALYEARHRARVNVNTAAASYLMAPVAWRGGESVDAGIRLDSIHGLPEGLLMKSDKMGMAHGLELRSPFLDRAFVEWTARLEISHHLRGRTSKYLLKKAAGTLLPRDLIHRRKQGFQVPMGRWLRGPLRGLVEEAFSRRRIAQQGIFDVDALAALRSRFDRPGAGPALVGQVWQIVAFQTWWRGLFEPSSRP